MRTKVSEQRDIPARDSVTKMSMINGVEEYIIWYRKVKAYFQHTDISLVGIKEVIEGESTSRHGKWFEFITQANSIVIPTLADGPLARVSAIIDDEPKTEMGFWNHLKSIFCMSNTQMVINVECELERLNVEKDEHREGHVKRLSLLISNSTPCG